MPPPIGAVVAVVILSVGCAGVFTGPAIVSHTASGAHGRIRVPACTRVVRHHIPAATVPAVAGSSVALRPIRSRSLVKRSDTRLTTPYERRRGPPAHLKTGSYPAAVPR